MSDENPFGDPTEADNPFGDPSVQHATINIPPANTLDDYNPFGAEQTKPAAPLPPKPAAPPPVESSPAVLPPEAPPAYTPTAAAQPRGVASSYGTSTPTNPRDRAPSQETDTTAFLKQREELERREAALREREQQFRSETRSVQRINNFPPLPEKCCVHPCFYQDFDIDIPVEFQSIVKYVYYLWIAYVVLLVVNVIGSLTYFIATMQSDEKSNNSGVTFGISLLFLVLFVPCSFVCWYRPLYKAFRSDSSISFFIFFFIFFFQFVANIILAVGFDGWGTVGIVSGLGIVTAKSGSLKAVGTIMIFIGILFGLLAAADVVMLVRVHRIYRRTGASFEKAQEDFARGVMKNSAVQSATKEAVSAGVQGALQGGTARASTSSTKY